MSCRLGCCVLILMAVSLDFCSLGFFSTNMACLHISLQLVSVALPCRGPGSGSGSSTSTGCSCFAQMCSEWRLASSLQIPTPGASRQMDAALRWA